MFIFRILFCLLVLRLQSIFASQTRSHMCVDTTKIDNSIKMIRFYLFLITKYTQNHSTLFVRSRRKDILNDDHFLLGSIRGRKRTGELEVELTFSIFFQII